MTERTKRAIELRDKKKYNCAQGVVCAYCDLFGIDEETAYKMSEGFGSGMGLMEVCGALSGAFMLAGLKNSAGTSEPGKTKGSTYKLNKSMATAFKDKNGSYLCRELKGVGGGEKLRSCPGCIEDACEILEKYILTE